MLKNKINGKIYIGQTIRPIQKRFNKHQHKSSRCRAIYNVILKYGWDLQQLTISLRKCQYVLRILMIISTL